MGKDRLMFFDIVRIFSILAIVIYHISQVNNYYLNIFGFNPFNDKFLAFNIFYTSFGIIGVYFLVFVSGAVLEYNHSKIDVLKDYLTFYLKRLLRIYPIFWISMIMGLIIAPTILLSTPLLLILAQFTGFTAFAGYWGGNINQVSWFIGLIIILYLLFPIISKMIRKKPCATMILFIIIDFGSRYLINTYQIGSFAMDRWLPLCNLAEFGFGIFLVRMGWYPKIVNNNNILRVFCDVSFYVFLMHHMILSIATMNLAFYAIAVMVLSIMLYAFDEKLQTYLKSITHIIQSEAREIPLLKG